MRLSRLGSLGELLKVLNEVHLWCNGRSLAVVLGASLQFPLAADGFGQSYYILVVLLLGFVLRLLEYIEAQKLLLAAFLAVMIQVQALSPVFEWLLA